jgi:branched-chain amino acid transport system permease protein
MLGALIGGLLLGLVQHLGVSVVGSEWQDSIAFAILVLFLLFRPCGILGTSTETTRV